MDKAEEEFYATAAREIATKQMAPGIMAKAYVDAAGDEKRAIILYIQMRVENLKTIAEQLKHEAELRRNAERYRKVNEELQIKISEEEKKYLSQLDSLMRSRYAILRGNYGHRVVKVRSESISQFIRRLNRFWDEYQAEM